MKVLFVGQPGNLEPWFGDVVVAVGREHGVVLAAQFATRRLLPTRERRTGSTLALVGLGASARELAKRASAFGMRVIGLDARRGD